MKKVIAMVLTVAAMSSLVGCSGQEAETVDDGGLDVVVVSAANTIDDGSTTEDMYRGVLNFIDSRNGIDTVKAVRSPTTAPESAIQTISDVVADYDVVVCLGFEFVGLSKIAMDNSETDFIIIDAFPADPGDPNLSAEIDTVYGMQFAEQESGFFAGISAAMETESGKVAVVNGQPFPSNVNYQFGFESGVHYANAHYGTNAELVEMKSYAGIDFAGNNVGGNYTGSFSDESIGKVLGNVLLGEGCDTIFVAAGGCGNGVFTAVKESGGNAKVIGVDVDQYDEGVSGNKNIILTSAVKNISLNVERQLLEIADGKFKGGNHILATDTDSVGYVSKEGRQQLSADTLKGLEEAYDLLKDGTIVPASADNGYTPEEFPGL